MMQWQAVRYFERRKLATADVRQAYKAVIESLNLERLLKNRAAGPAVPPYPKKRGLIRCFGRARPPGAPILVFSTAFGDAILDVCAEIRTNPIDRMFLRGDKEENYSITC